MTAHARPEPAGPLELARWAAGKEQLELAGELEQAVCTKCEQKVDEVCGDGFCRGCHVSLSFEDCVSGAWVAEVRRDAGLPPLPWEKP